MCIVCVCVVLVCGFVLVCILYSVCACVSVSTFPVVSSRGVETVQEVVVVVLREVHTSGTILHHTFNLRERQK